MNHEVRIKEESGCSLRNDFGGQGKKGLFLRRAERYPLGGRTSHLFLPLQQSPARGVARPASFWLPLRLAEMFVCAAWESGVSPTVAGALLRPLSIGHSESKRFQTHSRYRGTGTDGTTETMQQVEAFTMRWGATSWSCTLGFRFGKCQRMKSNATAKHPNQPYLLENISGAVTEWVRFSLLPTNPFSLAQSPSS